MKPDELIVHHSWIAGDMSRCFMLVEAEDVTILQRWAIEWNDLSGVRDRSGGDEQGYGRRAGRPSLSRCPDCRCQVDRAPSAGDLTARTHSSTNHSRNAPTISRLAQRSGIVRQ
ncbi:DUF3303 domain-containing protein [Mesorhizobium atlanticum]